MRLSRVCIFAMCILLGALANTRAAAQSPGLPTDRPLTLMDCINYAVTQHNSVRSAESDLTGSIADVKRAKSAYAPKFAVGSAFSSIGALAGTGNTGFLIAQGTDTLVTLSQSLYDGGRTQTLIRQARAARRSADADLELSIHERVLAVTTGYFNYLLAKRLADIAAQSVAESQGQLELIQARIDAKDAAPVDIYPVEVQLANAKLVKLQADNDVRVAGNTLRNAIGLDRGPELKLVDVTEPSQGVPALEDSLTKALLDRPEIVRSEAQLDSSKAALTLARLQALPVPTANAGYQQDLDGNDIGKEWTLGLGVSMSLFDGGALAAGVTSARARVQSAVLTNAQLRKDISTEVEEAYLNLTNALQRLEASRPSVTLAQKNLEVAREKYVQGMAIPLEIVNAQLSYADAQASNAQSLYDSYIARAQLDIAAGKRGY